MKDVNYYDLSYHMQMRFDALHLGPKFKSDKEYKGCHYQKRNVFGKIFSYDIDINYDSALNRVVYIDNVHVRFSIHTIIKDVVYIDRLPKNELRFYCTIEFINKEQELSRTSTMICIYPESKRFTDKVVLDEAAKHLDTIDIVDYYNKYYLKCN